MGKKLPYTTKAKLTSALRSLWLKSRERAAALKRDKYTCQCCGKKQSKAKGKEFKVEVHHINHIENWDEIYIASKRYLFCDPEYLQTLCKECHKKEGV